MLAYFLIIILLFDFGFGVKPVLDVANNMRLVLLPGKTFFGSLTQQGFDANFVHF